MNGGHFVLAYHGCDVTVRDALVSGQLRDLTPSDNDYDWLGPGAYFFEDDPIRAMQFALSAAAQPGKRFTRHPIASPSLVGAVLRINHWLDMTTQRGLDEFKTAHSVLAAADLKQALPRNEPADAEDTDVILRRLDRAVFKTLHLQRETAGSVPYDAVRAAFQQGPDLIESSAFKRRSHMQIALRNSACVKGWFIVPDHTRLLSESALEAAKCRLSNAKSNLSHQKRRTRGAAQPKA
ncbi:MAG: hypothetical protein JWQ11_3426 [Rhizobacter sp.]|nr:hypothetical protein [Rhizobacter sp.]